MLPCRYTAQVYTSYKLITKYKPLPNIDFFSIEPFIRLRRSPT